MRKVLRLLGSRYGIAAMLLLVVVAVVVIAKANTPTDPGGRTNSNGTVDNIEPGAPDDGFSSPEPTGTDDAISGVLPENAVATASAFAAAWVDVEGTTQVSWYESVSQYATEEVKTQLKDIDPQQVPASKIQGEPVAKETTVEIDTDQGLLILRMTEENGNWLVAGIDFLKT